MDHIILICPEPVRALQQGIGIRFIEMARSLSAITKVSLWVPNSDYPSSLAKDFEIRIFPEGDFPAAIGGARMVLVHGHVSEWYFHALRHFGLGEGPPLVVDLYDPFLIENLHYVEELGEDIYRRDREVMASQLAAGDYFIASSETQRLFYLGIMIGTGDFSPKYYIEDPSLDSLIGIAPYGVRSIPEAEYLQTLSRIKGIVPGIGQGDIVIFFGGVYDWYDPELFLSIFDEILRFEPRAKVIFSQNPNPETTPQGVYARILQLSQDRGWSGQQVFFLPWFPYMERVGFLKDVDIALSLHKNSIETVVSLRTRILEYMNLRLPVISTSGGETERILTESGGGFLVPEADPAALKQALQSLLADAELRKSMGERGKTWIEAQMTWQQSLLALTAFAAQPKKRQRGTPSSSPSSAPKPLKQGPIARLLRVLTYWSDHGTRQFIQAALKRLQP